MNILFIAKRFYTNRDALLERYGRIYQLPHYWQQNGAETKLWLLDYHGKDTIRTSRDSLSTISTPLRKWSFFKQFFETLLRRNFNPQIIVASGDCYIGFMAWLLAKLLRVKFVFDIYDRYDEFGGYRRILWCDPLRFLRDKADACFFASSAVNNYLGGHRITDLVVPNGIDTQHFKPLDKVICRAQLALPRENIIVGYFGSMERDRGVDDLLEAISILVDEGLEILLLIAGKTDQLENLQRPYVNYLGNVPYQQMPTVLACCDLLALPYRRSPVMDAGASNKIIEYIAAGRPIAATRTPNLLANFVDNEDFVKSTAEPGDPKSLSECIKNVLETPIKLTLPAGHIWPDVADMALTHLLDLDRESRR